MDKNKFYTVKKTINGTEYTAQFSGISAALRAADNSHLDASSEVISAEKYGQYILDNIIVEPKGLTADDFETIEDYNTVTSWGRDVMQGKFRDGADADTAKKAGK